MSTEVAKHFREGKPLKVLLVLRLRRKFAMSLCVDDVLFSALGIIYYGYAGVEIRRQPTIDDPRWRIKMKGKSSVLRR